MFLLKIDHISHAHLVNIHMANMQSIMYFGTEVLKYIEAPSQEWLMKKFSSSFSCKEL